MKTKYVIIAVVVALVAGIVIGYATHGNPVVVKGTLTPGVVNNVPRSAQVAMAGQSTSTWASLYNSDSNDRIMMSLDLAMVGTAGIGSTSAETLQCATSTNASDLNSNSNYFANLTLSPLVTTNVNISANGVSTAIASTSNTRIWAAGTYLNCVAASGALWTSTTTGEVRIPYIPM